MPLTIVELIGWAITLLGIFTTIMIFLVKVLLASFEKRLGERFATQDRDIAKLAELERDFLKFQAELPMQYVHRSDYVRNQTVIEAKLDGLRDKLEVVQIQGAKHD